MDKKFNVGDIIHAYYYSDGEFIYHRCEVTRKEQVRYNMTVKITQYIKYMDNGRMRLSQCPNIDDIGVVSIGGSYLRLYLTHKDDELAYKKFEEYYINDMNKKIEEVKKKLEKLRKSKEETK